MINNCGLSFLIVRSLIKKEEIQKFRDNLITKKFKLTKNWNCKIKNFNNRKIKTEKCFTLIQNDLWKNLNILINKTKNYKSINSSINNLENLLIHVNYFENSNYEIKGEIFEFSDFRICFGIIFKNNFKTKNFCIFFEFKSLKQICFEFENYCQILKNFFEIFFENNFFNDIEFEINRNWKVYNKMIKEFGVNTFNINEKIISLLFYEHFSLN